MISSLYYLLAWMLRLVRAIVPVRCAPLHTETLGFLASEPTIYLLERRRSLSRGRRNTLDCLVPSRRVANRYLLAMWRREIFVTPPLPGFIDLLHRYPEFHSLIAPWRAEQYYDREGLIEQHPPILEFSEEELARGAAALTEMGVPRGAPFVALSVRESAHDYAHGGRERAERERYRESGIEDYVDAARYLASEGMYVLRMGAAPSKPFALGDPRIIDYASHYRCEFLDLFLCAHCHFFLGDGGGLVNVARIFKRPIALTNWIPMGVVNTAPSDTLIIHKRLYDRRHDRPLSLAEQFASPANEFTVTAQYEEHEIGWINNTAEEILLLTQEMTARLAGRWEEPPGIAALQAHYWSLFPPGQLREPVRARIGSDFLIRYLNAPEA